MAEEGKTILQSGMKQRWVGFLLAGVLVVGLGVFAWMTVRQVEPAIEIISSAGNEEVGADGQIVVDVSGAVNEPGIYTFTANSRVEAALRAAGGVSAEADTEWLEKNINRADKLMDGMKIYIPKTSTTDNSDSAKAAPSKCTSLNEASQAQLEELPGVGPVTAGKIIAGRPYSKILELKEKKIVGEKVYGDIEAKVCVW